MLEVNLSMSVRRLMDLHGLFWQRFEDAVQRGIPDTYIGPGLGRHERGVWLENKITTSANAKPVYRPGQLPWAMAAAKRGERCRTLAACPDWGSGGVHYRVFDTAAIGEAVAFEQEWPAALYLGPSLPDALSEVLGFALNDREVA